MMGVAKPTAKRMLESQGVHFHRMGGDEGKQFTTLADLETAFPALLDSLRFQEDEE